MKNAIRIAIVAIAAGTGASAVQAGHSEDRLVAEAHRVVAYANELTREANLHFRHTDEFCHLISDAAKIRDEARHIDGLAHHVHSIDDVRHLQADLRDLDRLVHHVGDLIGDINHGHVGGHTHGDTHHVECLVADINRSLHSMQRLVGEMERGCSHGGYDHDDHRGHASTVPVRPTRRYESRSLGEQIAGQVLRDVFGGLRR